MKQFLKQITKPLHMQVYNANDKLRSSVSFLERDNKKIQTQIEATLRQLADQKKQLSQLQKQKENLNTLNEEFHKQLQDNTESELDKYAKKRYRSMDMPAYQQKRTHQDKPIAVYINQMFTPNAFEVEKVRRKLQLKGHLYNQAKTAGTWQAKQFTWTDDKQLTKSGDYYLYPEEIIVTFKGDCEDHSFCLASIVPGLGVAYGFFDNGRQRFGHAWNVLVYGDTLYHIETTGNTVKFHRDDRSHPYTTHFIITQNHAYRVKSGVRFGELAQW